MGSIRKTPAGRHRALWRDPAGRQRSKTFKTKREANAFLAEIESALHRGTYVDPDAGRMKVGTFAARWLESRAVEARTAERTLSILRTHILPQWADWPLSKVDHMAVQEWVTRLGRSRARGTVVRCHSVLSMILKTAVRTRLIAVNPAGGSRFLPAGEERLPLRRSARRTSFVTSFRRSRRGSVPSSAPLPVRVCAGASAPGSAGVTSTWSGAAFAWSRSRWRHPTRWRYARSQSRELVAARCQYRRSWSRRSSNTVATGSPWPTRWCSQAAPAAHCGGTTSAEGYGCHPWRGPAYSAQTRPVTAHSRPPGAVVTERPRKRISPTTVKPSPRSRGSRKADFAFMIFALVRDLARLGRPARQHRPQGDGPRTDLDHTRHLHPHPERLRAACDGCAQWFCCLSVALFGSRAARPGRRGGRR